MQQINVKFHTPKHFGLKWLSFDKMMFLKADNFTHWFEQMNRTRNDFPFVNHFLEEINHFKCTHAEIILGIFLRFPTLRPSLHFLLKRKENFHLFSSFFPSCKTTWTIFLYIVNLCLSYLFIYLWWKNI